MLCDSTMTNAELGVGERKRRASGARQLAHGGCGAHVFPVFPVVPTVSEKGSEGPIGRGQRLKEWNSLLR